jgi:hypothetical protein
MAEAFSFVLALRALENNPDLLLKHRRTQHQQPSAQHSQSLTHTRTRIQGRHRTVHSVPRI